MSLRIKSKPERTHDGVAGIPAMIVKVYRLRFYFERNVSLALFYLVATQALDGLCYHTSDHRSGRSSLGNLFCLCNGGVLISYAGL